MIDPHRSIFKFKGAVRNIPGNVRRHEVTESLRTVPENMGKGKIFKELRQRILFSQWVKRDMEISIENRTGKEKRIILWNNDQQAYIDPWQKQEN